MGFNIYYEGTVKIDKPLDNETYNIIMGLSNTRRMVLNIDKLEVDGIANKKEVGEWGEFFFGHGDMRHRELMEFEKKYVIDVNSPPIGQPAIWGVWVVTEDRMGLIWSRKEKSYCGHEWLQYIVKSILVPRGYNTEGIINWFTERNPYGNEWHTVVKGKSVRKYRGYNKNQKCPDINAWYKEESEEYDRCHQKWVQELIDKRIEFLHQRISMIKGTSAKSILTFNLFIDNNIIQVEYDEKNICWARYLYKNIKKENEKLVHDEMSVENEMIENDIILQRVKKIVEKYIRDNPDFLDEAVI